MAIKKYIFLICCLLIGILAHSNLPAANSPEITVDEIIGTWKGTVTTELAEGDLDPESVKSIGYGETTVMFTKPLNSDVVAFRGVNYHASGVVLHTDGRVTVKQEFRSNVDPAKPITAIYSMEGTIERQNAKLLLKCRMEHVQYESPHGGAHRWIMHFSGTKDAPAKPAPAAEKKPETQTAPEAATPPASTAPVAEKPATETPGKTGQQFDSAAPKQAEPQPDAARIKEESDREWRKNFMQRDISAEKLLKPENPAAKGEPYGSTMDNAAPQGKGADPFGSTMENVDPKKTTIFEIMRSPQGVGFYSANAEKAEEYMNGVLSRTADVVAPPVGAGLGLWNDFADNVRRGDGVILSAGKSFSGNAIYGLAGTVGSSIDLVTFSAGGESQHSLQDAVKGNINLVWDIVTRVEKEEKIERARDGHYGYKHRYYDGSSDYFKVTKPQDPREHERFKHDGGSRNRCFLLNAHCIITISGIYVFFDRHLINPDLIFLRPLPVS